MGRMLVREGRVRVSDASRASLNVLRTLFLVVFTCVFPFLHRVNNPNENVRVYMTMAMVDHHTFANDEVVEEYGWTSDMAIAPDKFGVLHHYSVKAPAISYLGVPVYAAYRSVAPAFGLERPSRQSSAQAHERWLRGTVWALRFATVQLPCLVGLLLFERWLRRISRDGVLRLATLVAVGLGTNHLASANLFASHAPVAWATFASFALIFRSSPAKPSREARPFLAGVCAGLATLFEYHALPMSAALALLAAWRMRRVRAVGIFALGAATQASLLMFYQWRAYGNPLTPGHKMCENPEFAAAHAKGLFGITLPDPVALRELSFNTTFGFFGTSPFMVLALAALPLVLLSSRAFDRRWRGHLLGACAVMLPLWLAVSAFVSWRGGWTIGPRFFGAAPPFMGLMALIGLEAFASRGTYARLWARAVASGLAIASVATLGVLGVLVSSIPEDVVRPVPDIVVPLLVAALVPHHVGEVLGAPGLTGYFIILGALVLASLVPLALKGGDRIPQRVARTALALVVAVAGLGPALMVPETRESAHAASRAREFFLRTWEPRARDRWTQLRAKQAAQEADACDYVKLARIERLWRHEDLAASYTQEAVTRGGCKNLLQRF